MDQPKIVVQQEHALLSVWECTPQEYFYHKVRRQEYEEALRLAEENKLDKDPVYRMMWMNSDLGKEVLQLELFDQLQDRLWILEAVVSTVCPKRAAMESLLLYGLRETDKFAQRNPLDVCLSLFFLPR